MENYSDLRQKLSSFKRKRSRSQSPNYLGGRKRSRSRTTNSRSQYDYYSERSNSQERGKTYKYSSSSWKGRSRSSSKKSSRSGSKARRSSSRKRKRETRSRSKSKIHSRSRSRRRYSRSRSSSRYRNKSRSPSRRRNSKPIDDWSLPNLASIPSGYVSSSSSPSPPRYDSYSQNMSLKRKYYSLDNQSSFFGLNQGILSKGKSIEECRKQIRQEMEYLKQQDLLMEGQQSNRSVIETIELDSEEEDVKSDVSKTIMLSDLDLNVTEMEIRRSICYPNFNIGEPSKISITKLSGKCNAVLQFDNVMSADLWRKQLEDKTFLSELIQSGPPPPASPGVSPPRYLDTCEPIHILDETSTQGKQIGKNRVDVPDKNIEGETMHRPKVVPIFVEIIADDGNAISKIKVHLYLHGKCQLFHSQEPKILISAFLNYMKKYFPSKDDLEFVFLTPCPASFTLFYSALKENAANKQVFDYYFNYWSDTQTIVKSQQQGSKVLRGCFYQNNKEIIITFK